LTTDSAEATAVKMILMVLEAGICVEVC
jgi:hypothetical protein